MGQPGSRQPLPTPASRVGARRWLRVAGIVLLSLVLVAVAGMAAVRFWVFPRFDTYRPVIEHAVSQAIQAPVRIDTLSAQWHGLTPHLQADGIAVLGPNGEPALQIAQLGAGVSWRSLLHWQPELTRLAASGVTLLVQRETPDIWWVAGRRLQVGKREGRLLERPAMQWVLRQPSLQVSDATVRFVDGMGELPDLVLTDGGAALEHETLGPTRVSAQARPPAGLGTLAQVQGELQRDSLLDASGWHGQFQAEWQDADLGAWQPLIAAWRGESAPVTVAGRVSARAQFEVDHGAPGAWSGDVELTALAATGEVLGVQVPAGTLHLQGEPAREVVTLSWAPLTGTLSLPRWFEAGDIPVQDLVGSLKLAYAEAAPVWRFSGLQGTVGEPGRQARFETDGQWHRGGRSSFGLIDLKGRVTQADARAVARFMPRQIGPAVRRWLNDGIQAGTVHDASVVLRGDLTDFPFDKHPDAGEFTVSGRLSDVALDVLPQRAGTWPRFEDIAGTLRVERASLSAHAESAVVRAGLPSAVAIGPTAIDIPDLHAGAVLDVGGTATGPAPAFLAYVRETPLSGFTGGLLDEAQADGVLTVPVQVTVPLGRVQDTAVEGEVQLSGNRVQLHRLAPPITGAQGAVTFTEDSVGARQLRAQWLGGPVSADGELALSGGGAIRLAGSVLASAVRRAWPADVLGRLDGRLSYTGEITNGDDGVALNMATDLRGLAIDLPAPLAKPADRAWPTTLSVRHGQASGTYVLQAAVADTVNGVAEFAAGDGGVVPQRVGLGVGRPAALPREGVMLGVSTGVLDVSRWADTLQAFGQAGEDEAGAAAADWAAKLPLRAEVQARRIDVVGQRLDAAQVTVERTAAGAWSAQVQARQADGRVTVTPGTPDTWHGRFRRLMLEPAPGNDADKTDAAPPDTTATPNLPDIDLAVDQFGFHGLALGAVRVAADNVGTDGHRWRVRELTVTNPDATLTAHGMWEPVNGATRRRTTLEASLEMRDAGALLARLGFDGVAAGGVGHAKGSVGWAGAPFSYDVAGLDAHVGVALDDGRFLQTDSTAARLLGILSLQTLARTATFSEGNLFKSGFAWETLRSELSVSGGVAKIDSFNLHGASATVVLSGEANLVAETADLRAVIVPHVDASGAALVAGLAVNPLIGAGAFLAQWLLQKPISDALTREYAVTGPWREPRVQRIGD